MYQCCVPQYLCGFLRRHITLSTSKTKHKTALLSEDVGSLANRAITFLQESQFFLSRSVFDTETDG